MKFLNGYKSIISSIVLLVVNSDWFIGLIEDPNLYDLIQGAVVIALGGSIAHHIRKDLKKKREEKLKTQR